MQSAQPVTPQSGYDTPRELPDSTASQPVPPAAPVQQSQVVQPAQVQQQPASAPVLVPEPQEQEFVSEIEEVNMLAGKLQNSLLPEELREKGMGMVKRLQKMARYGSFSKEYESVEKYVSTITSIPWGKYTEDNLDLTHVKAQLDKTHFGVENIKERMLEYVAMLNLRLKKDAEEAQQGAGTPEEMARLQGSSSHAPILALVGIQGIGKTSIAKSIATALGRKFVRISLGGLAGVTELRGRSRGEPDAEPGQVIKALIRTEVMNPMILMDEIDKISESSRADVMAALLEILDPEQNSTFRDNFIDYPVDLSNVIFVATANNLGGISAALLDRLEVVRMISYSDDEKMHIARDYLLPKVLSTSGLDDDQITFDDQVWPLVIRPLGFDAGIRELERTLTRLVRKVAKQVVMGQGEKFHITPENFRQYIPEDIGVMS
ncbi:MAG: Lon protease 1 [candidate division WS6 bacterium OLB20]|uniref:Lon protease 1 n=1 Tax=candidate division WS6 bacterium OLB20 TaxID=1617426 RepID=A0A136LYR8_9BACT|nr:MAG: Lon protease 1 [candidate division WS6 bacterium OLB20]